MLRVFVFLYPRPSAPYVGPWSPGPPGPIEFLSAVFDFLPVCVKKCSCASLVKYNFEFSIHKY